MKGETRSKIIKIIEEEGATRPITLVHRLKITPQAIHRHLKRLLAEGALESRGRGPLTRYFLAGRPDLERAMRWYAAAGRPDESPAEFICETRDVFSARLSQLKGADLPLLISAVGEVGNNCYDHNLGQWRDVPGCWHQAQAAVGKQWVCIADRGQGIWRSLARVAPELKDEQSALVAAFERTISGRAPENRGNGLKFVKNIMTGGGRRGLACRSGKGIVNYGPLGPDCERELESLPDSEGTITLIAWSL
ncbi:MAG: winged helix-turn-helix transcriptional regulator [Elusimicrobia bacterium]|nr:winged helix-turn-helix transcriptional regulator [Elusimicrobiota bacterium]